MLTFPFSAAMAFLLAAFQQIPEARVAQEPMFSSDAHESKPYSSIGRLDGAMMLAPNRFALADGQRQAIYFVDALDGSFSVVRDAAFDPATDMATMIVLADRLPGELLVVQANWSQPHIILSSNGEVVDSISDAGSSLVHVLPDRTPVFRRVSPPIGFLSGGFRARQEDPTDFMRSPTRYVAVTEAEVTTTIAQAPGAERAMVSVSFDGRSWGRAQPVVFGNKLLTTRAGDYLVVAQTDSDSIAVYDRTGDVVSLIPMPGTRVEVSPEQVRAQRQLRIQEQEIGFPETRQAALLSSAIAEMTGENFAFLPDSILLSRVPANRMAPSIDRLLADDSGQVWIRLLPMPEDTVTRWMVWNMDRSAFVFNVTLPRHERLLDASFGRLLLASRDTDGRQYLMIRQLQQ